jgi:pSer/pThr/pTyr-binding forkhead associated (FHA) protein
MDVFLSISSTTDGGVQEVRYSLSESLVVGRGAEGGVLLEGPDLSREHLAFTSEGGSVYVTDLSVNGTWVNGKRLRKSVRQRVSPEDSIELPGYVLKYRFADQPELVEEAAVDQTSQ